MTHMANQPPVASVSRSSLRCFKFNLKWMGCGLWRQPEKARRRGGRSCLLILQLLQHLGSCSRWSLVIVISNYTDTGFAAVSRANWRLNSPPAPLFSIRDDKKLKASWEIQAWVWWIHCFKASRRNQTPASSTIVSLWHLWKNIKKDICNHLMWGVKMN